MSEATCALCGHVKKVVGRGLCKACYQVVSRRGDLQNFVPRKRSFDENLRRAQNAETAEGCWPWPYASPTGYPTATGARAHAVSAHVMSWTRVNGPVPAGLTLDHLCHTRSASCVGAGVACLHRRCVRPDHLEPVTPAEQQRRRTDYSVDECRRGHSRTAQNVLWQRDRKGRWYRQCRDCNHENYLRRKEQASS